MELAHKLFSTRGGTLALAGGAALIAAIAVFAYVKNYRQSVQKSGAPASVLVAKAPIAKGTPGSVISAQGLYQVESIRNSELKDGALSDVGSLAGRVAATDVLAGQQLTASDFTAGSTTIASKLSGDQRAISIPIDNAHGLINDLHSGDHVDVYAGFDLTTATLREPVLTLLAANVPVLDVNKTTGGIGSTSTATVTLRVASSDAVNLAFASDNGKVWLVERPPTGAQPPTASIVSVESILARYKKAVTK